MVLLIATGNAGKQREYGELLHTLGARLRFPAELGLALHVPEDRPTYRQNALQKATSHCRATGLITLAALLVSRTVTRPGFATS